jgi:hypothetical protein
MSWPNFRIFPTCLVASCQHLAHGSANREDVLKQPRFALVVTNPNDPIVQLLIRLDEEAVVAFIDYLYLWAQAAAAAATPAAAVEAAADKKAATTTPTAWAKSKATSGARSRSNRAQQWRH